MSAISSGSGQDFDLNIAPIIDCFTVLITYLLVSASFISYSVMEAGVAATSDAVPPIEATKPIDPPMSLMISMKQAGGFEIKLTGGIQNIDKSELVPNKEIFNQKMNLISQQWPMLKEVNIGAEPTILYKDMIKTIEDLKNIFPKVFITGS